MVHKDFSNMAVNHCGTRWALWHIAYFYFKTLFFIMVYKDFTNMAVDHFGHLPFVWRFKDRYLMMADNWFVTQNLAKY